MLTIKPIINLLAEQNLINEQIEHLNEDETLEEAKMSVVKRGLGSKRAALAGGTAMQIAKKKNPALIKMYQKHNLIRKQIKAKIMKQYGAMAKALAKKKLK